MLNGHTVQSVNALVFVEGFESVLRYNQVQGLGSNVKYGNSSQQEGLTSV